MTGGLRKETGPAGKTCAFMQNYPAVRLIYLQPYGTILSEFLRHSMKRLKCLAVVLILCFVFCPPLAGQHPVRRATSVPDLFNQEAAASDPAGIHKYSEGLIELIVPPGAERLDIEPLANRLARAEQMARSGKGKLVPEADVVRAFNELMAEVGAPPSLRADEASMRRFREYAVSIKAFPALFTADRNGTNCNPGEAVFLLYLLITNDGTLPKQYLYSAQILTQLDDQRNEGGRSFGVARVEILGSSASRLLSSYSSHHNRNATIGLFNNLAGILGF